MIPLPVGVAAASVSSAAAWIRHLPEHSKTIELLKNASTLRREKLELQEQLKQQAHCTTAATVWCKECGELLCPQHDRLQHPASVAVTHPRLTLVERQKQQAEMKAAVQVARAAEVEELRHSLSTIHQQRTQATRLAEADVSRLEQHLQAARLTLKQRRDEAALVDALYKLEPEELLTRQTEERRH